jgi:hypothetical protein
MRNYHIVSMGVILVAAVIVTSFQASARSRGGGSSMSQMSRGPSGMSQVSRVPSRSAVVRDHRASAERAQRKVIRAGRNYDKVKGRDQVIVNGKRVPRKV